MSDPTNGISYKLPDPANLLADHIREVATTDGHIRDGNVLWNEFVIFEGPVRDALLIALQDLYIDPDEAGGIMERTNNLNHDFANRLVNNLRLNPPLFQVAQLFCDQDKMDIKVRNTLQYVAQEDVNPRIQDAAQKILDSCKIFVATKSDE